MRRFAMLLGLLAIVGMVGTSYAEVKQASAVEETVTGSVGSVDVVKGEIVIITKEATATTPAVTKTIVVETGAVITLADGKKGELADLKKGDKVEVKIVDSKTKNIKVVK